MFLEFVVRVLALQDPAYRIVFVAAVLIWVLPEWIGSFFQRREAAATGRDRNSLLFLSVMLNIGIGGGILLAVRLPGAAIPVDGRLVFGAGIGLMLLGVALRWYAIRVLGRFFTREVAVRPGQTVVRTGPYRLIRHPSYSGVLLILLGLGLALGSAASLAVILAGAGLGLAFRVRVEEQALCQALGQPYIDYMRQTRRFIPFIF